MGCTLLKWFHVRIFFLNILYSKYNLNSVTWHRSRHVIHVINWKFSMNNAVVICRQLGFGFAHQFVSNLHYWKGFQINLNPAYLIPNLYQYYQQQNVFYFNISPLMESHLKERRCWCSWRCGNVRPSVWRWRNVSFSMCIPRKCFMSIQV